MALPHCALIGASGFKVRNAANRLPARRSAVLRASGREVATARMDLDVKQKGLDRDRGLYARTMDSMPPEGFAVLMSCAVGLLTGVGVVAFNYTVHEIHDIVWEGVPRVTWFRSQPLAKTWERIMVVPVGGGIVVGTINFVQAKLESSSIWSKAKAISKPLLKSLAAAVTLGTANSLGPEGPSVEIGASVGNGIGAAFGINRQRRLSLVAAGSAAGISSGFNAAVSGCFFAVESVLRTSSTDSAPSVTTAMVLLSSVLASIVSQAGLGRDPAFKIPSYDFRSPSELPLYLLLGVICGVLSVSLIKGSAYATSLFEKLKRTGIPTAFLPAIGGLCVSIIALAYPEVLYWGFENVDAILETRPWAKGPPADLLLQIVGAKIVATSLCRGSKLVGGVYAPSLFIGASLGSAYGKLASYTVSRADPMYHLDALIDVAAPQAYALVGMAAMLAGVCQVPFTAVLLLFELTRDYRIILPLMAAVGLSSWVASCFSEKEETPAKETADAERYPGGNELCSLEESLCVTTVDDSKLAKELLVSAAMQEKFLTVYPDATVEEALSLMTKGKEWCVLVIDGGNFLKGILTLGDIQDAIRKAATNKVFGSKVTDICERNVYSATPDMPLDNAQNLMGKRGFRQLPVLSEDGQIVGIIDQEAIDLACRVEATKRLIP